MKDSAKKPGVGRYDLLNSPSRKIIGNYTNKELKSGMLEEAIYKGMSTPPHYPAIDIERIKPRS